MRLLILCTCLLPALAWAQASVDESQESATIYVDTALGSDSNTGSSDHPLKTISASVGIAVSNNHLGIGTRVIVNSGVYRETININPSGLTMTAAPMTFQAAVNGAVIVSGAVPYTNWTAGGSPGVFTSPWAYQWGFCAADANGAPLEQAIVNRSEMIFVNGAPMTQVLSQGQMVAPGTFYVDETGGLLYLWPPVGTDMPSADIEVATLPQLMNIVAYGANPLNGIVIRGISFQYAPSCHASAAVNVGGKVSNVIFDSDVFSWNNGQGLAIVAATNITVKNSTSNHNGATGFQAYQLKNVLWQNVEASYNNWRGAQGAYYSWNTGGLHIFSDHSETLTGARLVYNQTHGIHWDTDDANIAADSIFASQNTVGILNEKNEGPITITNSQFCSSYSVAAGYAGFVLRNSDQTTLNGNSFYNNNVSQVLITGVAGGTTVTNWETGQVYNLVTQNLSFHNNVLDAIGAQQVFKDGNLGGSDWTAFANTLLSDNNTWWNATDATSFITPSAVQNTFAQWQALTLQDPNSVFAAPAVDPSTICAVTADAPDFLLIVDNGVVTADPSGTAVFNLETAGLGGLTGTVNLWLDGASSIPGGTLTLSSTSLNTTDAAVLSFHAATSTPPGTYTFTVIANAGGITRTVTLSAILPAITAWLSTNSLTFLNQPVNGTSAPKVVTLTNLSASPFSIASIGIGSGFLQTNTCGTALAAGANCTISVSFSPKNLVPYAASLNINDSVAGSPQAVALTGTVIGSGTMTLSTKSLSFGNGVYLKPSPPKSVTLTNTGTGLIDISSIAITGGNPNDFFLSGSSCGATLDINASCTVNITFVPAALGKRAASLSITDDAAKSPQAVTLSGSGTTAISYTPKSLSFLSTSAGSTSASKTVTVTNLSSVAFSVAGTITGGNPEDFTQTANCGSTLAGGASCTFTVRFSPQTGGALSATLSIADSDPTTPQVVTMTGTGTAITFTPKTLTFSSTNVGSASTVKTITVTNSGVASVPINSITVAGTSPGDFPQTNTCGTALAAGTSCTVTVAFAPQAAGARNANLLITDPDPSSPQVVTLSGTGYAIGVSSKALTFPSTDVGTTSTAQTITVTNLGAASVPITSITISGTNSSDFPQTNTCGTALAGGTSCTISVTFLPAATGSRTAAVNINDSDPSSPQKVTLNGTGN